MSMYAEDSDLGDRSNTRNSILDVLIKGVLAGAFIGLIVGTYADRLTVGQVIQKSDYILLRQYEDAQDRYANSMRLAFVSAFAFCGPFVAAASFGQWMKHAVYGVIGSLSVVLAFVFLLSIGNFVFSDVPIMASVKFPNSAVRLLQKCGVPTAFVIGPVVGIVFGRYRRRSQGGAR